MKFKKCGDRNYEYTLFEAMNDTPRRGEYANFASLKNVVSFLVERLSDQDKLELLNREFGNWEAVDET